jgi:hypothetical protein
MRFWPLIIFGFLFTILFVFVSWVIMLIGLVTGFRKFSLDRKIIGTSNEGWQKVLFPADLLSNPSAWISQRLESHNLCPGFPRI